MCDVIKMRLKRRIATRSWKGNQPLNIKTALELPILKLGLPNFKWSFYVILLLVASLLIRRIFMTSAHDTFQRFSLIFKNSMNLPKYLNINFKILIFSYL